jgi:hypothetical protein
MKPFKRLLVLFTCIVCIVAFWLIPGMNKAKNNGYVRVYEDTELKKISKIYMRPAVAIRARSMGDTIKENKKIYKEEKIRSRAKMKDIKASMFSRAIHFNEDIVLMDSINKIKQDSVIVTQILPTDSLRHN